MARRLGQRNGDRADVREPEETGSVLQGTVEIVTFHSEATLYTVLRIAPERGFDDPEAPSMFRSTRLTAVGPVARPVEGMRVRLTGRWVRHATHGRQFEFEALEELPPIETAGLVRYLASKEFEGIGPKLAERIVEALGPSALEIARTRPAELRKVQGLRPAVARALVETLHSRASRHELVAFLRGVGLGPAQALEVEQRLGPDAEELLRANPYRLSELPGFGFRRADQVALALGFERTCPERCRAALTYSLDDATGQGQSFLPGGALLESAAELLGLAPSDERLRAALDQAIEAGELVLERPPGRPGEPDPVADDVWLPGLLGCERALGRSLGELLAARPGPLADADRLATVEARSEFVLHPKQREAVLGLLAHPVALLTGGPGVGKTTIVRLVVELARAAGAEVRLASPTGRAAKRLGEATGQDASTIHRLLGYEPGTGGFQHHRGRPLDADLLVVDEISMLDVALAFRLFEALRAPTRVVLVGDPDQLPSVGPGQVLHDLLQSGRVPTFRLTQIFRQREGSRIVRTAHGILRGELPEPPPKGDLSSDYYFFPAEDPVRCAELVVDVATRRIPQRFGIAFADGVQVLAPMYRGECGVDALNVRLREAQGIGGLEVRRGDRIWRVGDRVIHTKNDYDKGVFNGDVGRIVDVAGDGSLSVQFPDQRVAYGPGELSDLQPAFAMTVHRAQGAEYPAVVLPMLPQQFPMLQRNLLYTAVTRARQLLVLVGSQRAVRMAIDNDEPSRRYSRLADRLAPPSGPAT